jgi:hypothetical protein
LRTRIRCASSGRALTAYAAGRLAEAAAEIDEVTAGYEADSGCGSVDALAARLNRALMLEKLGRLTEAEAELRAAVPGLAATLGKRPSARF